MDLQEVMNLSPARVLRKRFELEAALLGLPSPIGFQLANISEETVSTGSHGDGQEHKRIQYADYVLFSRDLNADEVAVCRARYWELARPEYFKANRLLDAMRDGDGDEILERAVRDDKGNPLPGWVRVRSIRQRFPGHAEIAEYLAERGLTNADGDPMSAGAVQKRLRTAHAKVNETLRWRKLKMMTEGDE